jgi:hypothetical protein
VLEQYAYVDIHNLFYEDIEDIISTPASHTVTTSCVT